MLRPVAMFVGLRYLRAQRSNNFASFVSFSSVAGVGLGVAALIVVLSVMNGFENELRSRLLSLTGHATVEPLADGLPWQDILIDLARNPRVVGAAPFVEVEAMLSGGRDLSGAILTGVDPQLEPAISEVNRRMRYGSLDRLESGKRNIILGRALALKLGVYGGDTVTVMVPRKTARSGLNTELRRFTVVGIFELGLRDHDGARALIHLDDAAAVTGPLSQVAGVRVKTRDVFDAPDLIRSWASGWAESGRQVGGVRDWTQDNATYFRAIRIEKIMMTLLLSLIVAVAVFNIVAMLVMVVTDKRPGIAILRTLGYSKRIVIQIFVFQGLVIGWIGVSVGVAAGIFLANNIDRIAPTLESVFGFEFMPADVYYLTSLPSDLHWGDVFWVSALALLMTSLATVYPAMKAASVAPAEVLRYA
jgi:lipoprotein-releasing system permease protein